MEKQWPIVSLLVGIVMLSVGISLALAHIGVGDIHEGVVVTKGIAPPYWARGDGSDMFLVIDEGGEPFIVLPVDRGTFSATEIGEEFTWEDHSLIDAYLWTVGLVGALFLVIGLIGVAVEW